MLEGITDETRVTPESMCYDGMCSLNVGDMWELFEHLAWYRLHCQRPIEHSACPSPPPYDLHVQSPCVDQFRDLSHHHSFYPRDVCSYCQSLDHDVNCCPYYDIFDECYAKLDTMIGAMNDQHKHFVIKIRECGLLHGTEPNLSFPSLEVSLCDDCESSLPLESSFVDDTPSTNLEEVFEPPLTSSSVVAPSSPSTPIGTTVSALTLLASPLPLAKCTRLAMGESFRDDVSVLKDDLLTWSKEPTLLESHLEEAPFEELCDDHERVGASPSFEYMGFP